MTGTPHHRRLAGADTGRRSASPTTAPETSAPTATARKPVVVFTSHVPVVRVRPSGPEGPGSAPEATLDSNDVKDLLTLLHPALSYDPVQKRARASIRDSLLLPCPHCYRTILTEVQARQSWLCCLAPAEADHRCPSCKGHIATYY